MSELYKLGNKLKKSRDQVDDDLWQLRYKRAKPFYNFELPTYEGGSVRLSELRGKVVMVDFWPPHCISCVAELSHLKNLVEKYKSKSDRFVFLVIVSSPDEDFFVGGSISSFMKRASFPFTVLKVPKLPDGTWWQEEKCGITFAGSVILDSEGRWIYRAPEMIAAEDMQTVENMIDGLLTKATIHDTSQ